MAIISNILIVGPVPPAIGGIATIIQLLTEKFSGVKGVKFLSTTKPSVKYLNIFHSIYLLFKIVFLSYNNRGGSMLMFSSAYRSFWEKCVWAMMAKVFGMRVIMLMVDGNYPRFFSKLPKYKKWLALKMIQNVNVLAVQSEQWKLFYEEIFPLSNVEIVNPGIDTDFFYPVLDKHENFPIKILYVGWLIKDKGIYDLLESAKILNEKGIEFTLSLLGPDFGNKAEILKSCADAKISDILQIIKPTYSRPKLRNIYQSADIFVFPSHYEGFPYALMEAVSSGLPCVGTAVGGIPDILNNGECGILVKPKDPQGLAKGLERLICDNNYRISISKAARYRAVNEYSLNKSFTDFKNVLCRNN